MREREVSERLVQDRRTRRLRSVRRRGSGPRPVRPAAVAVAVRPAEARRPSPRRSGEGPRPSSRLPQVRALVRCPLAATPADGRWGRVRGLLAGLAVTALVCVVVVGLGLLAEVAAGARRVADPAPASSGAITVVVGSERDNSLTPVPLRSGQVLSVTPR